MFTLLATTLSGAAHADSAAIKQLLAKLGVQSSDVQPSPIKGISTVLTDSGVIYVTDDGKHIIRGADVRRQRRAAGKRHQYAAGR